MLVNCFDCGQLVSRECVFKESVYEESFGGNEAGIEREFCPECMDKIYKRSSFRPKTTYTITFGGEQISTDNATA